MTTGDEDMTSRFGQQARSHAFAIWSLEHSVRAFLPAILLLLSGACDRTRSESGGDVSVSTADTSARSTSVTPWETARRRGVEFRAIGQEPGWLLDLDQGRTIRYAGDYGQRRIAMPAPAAPVRDTVTGTITYTAQSDSHTIAAVIREEPCHDVMSGEAFTHGVTLRVDDQELKGCGRVLNTGELENIYWRLTELQGEPAMAPPGPREAYLRLSTKKSAVTGSTGCNSIRGRFRLSGSRILIGPLQKTRMACDDPAIAGKERAYVAALERANRAVVRAGRLTLQAGDRAVARFEAVYLR
jgi:heat shock protein HslJ/uncharacterized membrane protein